MKSFEEFISRVREYNQRHPLSATQNVHLTRIEAAQLHRCNSEENPEFFYLIIGRDGDQFNVIPGSLDGIMAGPNDMVLPKSVMGGFTFFALDLADSLPENAIGDGFAILDKKSFQKVVDSLAVYRAAGNGTV